MNINHLIMIATAIFVVSGILFFRYRRTSRTGLSIFLGGIILSSFFLFLPYYHANSAETEFPTLRTIVLTLSSSLKSISGDQDIKELEKFALQGADERLKSLFYILNYIYFALAPLLTSSLILSLLGDMLDRIRCRLHLGRKYYIFSELSEHTLHLAKQIKADHPMGMIVFCSTKNNSKEQVLQAKNLGASTLYADCDCANIPLLGKQLQYYLISPNEDINLCCSESLLRRYKDCKIASVTINAFAESGTGIQMVEDLAKSFKSKRLSVRFINVTALLCNNLLLRHPLYQIPENYKTISVMIVGCDKTGMRMLKTVAWCGQVDGYQLKIRVYDKNAAFQEKKLRAQCPELMDNCDIRFLTVDAKTADLEQAVFSPSEGSADATYVVMTTGDDELNIEVADRLFRLFRHHNRYGWTPKILVRIRNTAKSDIYSDESNTYLKDRRIFPFGRMEDVFNKDTLFHSHLENLAFAVDLCYCGQLPPKKRPSQMSPWERIKYLSPIQRQGLRKNPHPAPEAEEPMMLELARMCRWEVRKYLSSPNIKRCRHNFLHSEYSRRSSMAAALHIGAKLHRCGSLASEETFSSPEAVQAFQMLLTGNDLLLEQLAQNEHQRWNQFMRSEGFAKATWEDLRCFVRTGEEITNQDRLAKRHLCLTDWNELDGLEKSYNGLNPPKEKHFKENDYMIVRQIPDILLLAQHMEKQASASICKKVASSIKNQSLTHIKAGKGDISR